MATGTLTLKVSLVGSWVRRMLLCDGHWPMLALRRRTCAAMRCNSHDTHMVELMVSRTDVAQDESAGVFLPSTIEAIEGIGLKLAAIGAVLCFLCFFGETTRCRVSCVYYYSSIVIVAAASPERSGGRLAILVSVGRSNDVLLNSVVPSFCKPLTVIKTIFARTGR
ncbi:hypothetical protein BDW59DRAFT_138174 [Aspergillus cavernicola]|uniref:Major facilitator superfamily (MFS) profile domain-containing protein n=1 Tax=Aspergillus cavernicola TaxID=176166 RepID=A0ABR4J171_9EURO